MAETEEANTSELLNNLGGFWGYVGFKLFDALHNLISNFHWVLCTYFLYLFGYEIARSETDNQLNIDVGNLYEHITDVVNQWIVNSVIVLILTIILMAIIIIVQRRTLRDYKRKVGRLESGIIDPLDSKRGSSNLTETGTTNPEDLP